jgi:hypothetical protein
MSEDRLKQSITDKGYEFVRFADDNDKCYSFSNRNASQVVLKLKCNHEKTVKVSTVYCKELCASLVKIRISTTTMLIQKKRLAVLVVIFIRIIARLI